MRFSKLVALCGLAVGVLGVIREHEILQIAGFVQISAACICRSVEKLKESKE